MDDDFGQFESSPEPECVEISGGEDDMEIMVDRIMERTSKIIRDIDDLENEILTEREEDEEDEEEEAEFERQFEEKELDDLKAAPFKEQKQKNNHQEIEGDKGRRSGTEDDNTLHTDDRDTNDRNTGHINDEIMNVIQAEMDTLSVPKCGCVIFNVEEELDAVIPPKNQYLYDIMIYLVTFYGILYFLIDCLDLENDPIAVIIIWIVFGATVFVYLGIMLVLKYIYKKIKDKEISSNMIILMVKLLLTSTMPFSYYTGYKKLFEILVMISVVFLVIIFLRGRGRIKHNICFILLLVSILFSIVAVLCYFLLF